MAFLVKRADQRFEIRETVATESGPRARTLASFQGVLTAPLLREAGRRAIGGFVLERLRERARALGVPVRPPQNAAARALLAELREGVSLDPVLVALLREALDEVPAAEPDADRAEAAEWIGATDAERGTALRGLLRVSDRIVTSRARVRTRRMKRFPRFRSRRAA